jgi:hypothetical protein
MAENSTTPTDASVDAVLAARASDAQRADCAALIALFRRVTGEEPKMWGPSIIGFSAYRYAKARGFGEMAAAGFAVRGKDLVVYLMAEADGQAELLARLGPHTMGKSCLYIKRLADLDVAVLESLIAGSVAAVRRLHPSA